jgi:16S rRNA (guanine966-N2)-methyltransferase
LRPTPDRLRETLFNVLAPTIEGAVFMDVYAGSGAVGIEALSRGAARAIFLEKHRSAVQIIHENLQSLGLEARAIVIPGPAVASLAQQRADIVFLDPPYALADEYSAALTVLGQSASALVVVQHARRAPLDEAYGFLRRTRVLTHGDNSLSFFSQVKITN